MTGLFHRLVPSAGDHGRRQRREIRIKVEREREREREREKVRERICVQKKENEKLNESGKRYSNVLCDGNIADK